MNIIELLQNMVRIPSFSREEGVVADMIERWLIDNGFAPHRKGHNLWLDSDDICAPETKDDDRPVILLNAHIDTVHPAKGYTRDPFSPDIEDGTIYGLGTNDDEPPLWHCYLPGSNLFPNRSLIGLYGRPLRRRKSAAKAVSNSFFRKSDALISALWGSQLKWRWRWRRRG